MTRKTLHVRYRLVSPRPLSEDQRTCVQSFINLGPVAAARQLDLPVSHRRDERATCGAFERDGDVETATVDLRVRLRKWRAYPELYHLTADQWLQRLARRDRADMVDLELESSPYAFSVGSVCEGLRHEVISVELEVEPGAPAGHGDGPSSDEDEA